MFDVLICAYNAAETLIATLGSLAMQRLARELNVYLIDDGSSKEDKEKYLQYKKMYENTFNSFWIIENETNKGIGYSRNVSLKASKERTNSPWIFFLDADDYFCTPYAFNILTFQIYEHPDAKLIHTPIIQENRDLTKKENKPQKDFQHDFWVNPSGNILYLHGRIYSRQAIEESGLNFPEYRSNEDTAFNLAFFHLYEKNIYLIPDNILCTCWNPKSITRSPLSTRQSFNHNSCNEQIDCYYSCKETFDILKQRFLVKGILPTLKNCSNYVDRFLMNCVYYEKDRSDTDEEDYVFRMAIYLYYRDIIEPLYKNNPILGINLWFTNPSFCLGPIPERSINAIQVAKIWGKEFDEIKFKNLCDKILTDKGYFEQTNKQYLFSALDKHYE